MSAAHLMDYLWRIFVSYLSGLYLVEILKRHQRRRAAPSDPVTGRPESAPAGGDIESMLADYSASIARFRKKDELLHALTRSQLQQRSYALCRAMFRSSMDAAGRAALSELQDCITEYATRVCEPPKMQGNPPPAP